MWAEQHSSDIDTIPNNQSFAGAFATDVGSRLLRSVVIVSCVVILVTFLMVSVLVVAEFVKDWEYLWWVALLIGVYVLYRAWKGFFRHPETLVYHFLHNRVSENAWLYFQQWCRDRKSTGSNVAPYYHWEQVADPQWISDILDKKDPWVAALAYKKRDRAGFLRFVSNFDMEVWTKDALTYQFSE